MQDGQPGYYIVIGEPKPPAYAVCPTCRRKISGFDLCDGRCSGCGEVLE